MAKAKAKVAPQAPEDDGFVSISGFSAKWEMETERTLIGEWLGKRSVSFMVGRSRDKEEVRTCVDILKEDGERVTLWESATLRKLFEVAEPGDMVRVIYKGLGEVRKRGQNPPKLFDYAIRTHDGRDVQ
jgi:hypothetical protein